MVQFKFLILSILVMTGCTPETISRGIKARTEEKNTVVKQPSLSTVDMNSDGIIITGENLESITKVQFTGGGHDKTFELKTQTDERIEGYVSSLPALTVLAGFTYNLIISTASAQTVFPITFSILDNSVTASKIASSAVETAKIKTKAVTYEKIDTTGAINGYVLTYNSSTGKWQASPPNTTPSGGTVTSITGGTGMLTSTGGTITTSGTLSVKVGSKANYVPYFNSAGLLLSDAVDGGIQILKQADSNGVGDEGAYLRFTKYRDNDSSGTYNTGDSVNSDFFIFADDTDLNFCSTKACTSGKYFTLSDAGGGSLYGALKLYENTTSGNSITLDYVMDDPNNNSGLQINGGFLCVGTSDECEEPESGIVKLRVYGSAFNSSGSSTWGALSDRRYKIIDDDFKKGLKELRELPLYKWHYDPSKISGSPLRQNVGPVAQDVQPLFPEAVTKNEDGRLVLNPDAIWWAGISAIKELDVINEEQAQEIKDLKLKNQELEERLQRLEEKFLNH